MRLIVLIVLSWISVGRAWAQDVGPFGLRMGMQPTEVGKPASNPQNGVYIYSRLPIPFSRADEYLLLFGQKSGLCKVVASGVTKDTSVYGSELKSEFTDIRDALVSKYGGSKNDYDFLKTGSIWDDPQDWMMALLKKERVLASAWEFTGRGDEVANLMLKANALGTNKGYVTIAYEFSNFSACRAELDASDNAGL